MTKKKPNKEEVLKCLEQSKGIVTEACKKASISRRTFYYWLKSDSDFSEQVKDIQEEIAVDFVEGKLLQSINDGNVTAQIFFLKTRGKHRGYAQETTLNVSATPTPPVQWLEEEDDN